MMTENMTKNNILMSNVIIYYKILHTQNTNTNIINLKHAYIIYASSYKATTIDL